MGDVAMRHFDVRHSTSGGQTTSSLASSSLTLLLFLIEVRRRWEFLWRQFFIEIVLITWRSAQRLRQCIQHNVVIVVIVYDGQSGSPFTVEFVCPTTTALFIFDVGLAGIWPTDGRYDAGCSKTWWRRRTCGISLSFDERILLVQILIQVLNGMIFSFFIQQDLMRQKILISAIIFL